MKSILIVLSVCLTLCLTSALAKRSNFRSSFSSLKDRLDCEGVQACGVLSLESGFGPGYYKHKHPTVHGLWPETGAYGSSKCLAPRRSDDEPTEVFACYDYGNESHQLEFEKHEWGKHGKCAGVNDANDYFTQICSLSKAPLAIMSKEKTLAEMEEAVKAAGYSVFKEDDTDSQIYLTACLNEATGKWVLADEKDFVHVCGNGKKPGNPTSGPSSDVCVPNKHGPSCRVNKDCAKYSGCFRCAHSGFCTSSPVSISTPTFARLK